jgi:hypothetical protein
MWANAGAIGEMRYQGMEVRYRGIHAEALGEFPGYGDDILRY